MRIEHCFRDWKSHLGLRGLRLQVQTGTHSAAVDGIYLGLFDLAAVGQDRSPKAAPFFEQPRGVTATDTENPECPLDGSLSTPIPLGTRPERWIQILSRWCRSRIATLSSFSP